DDMAAELADGDLECRPRAKRRLVEEHRDVAAIECIGGRRMAAERAIGFRFGGEREAALEVGGLEVEDGQEILARERRRGHCTLVARESPLRTPRTQRSGLLLLLCFFPLCPLCPLWFMFGTPH